MIEFSVIIPAFNAEKFIRRAVASASIQTIDNLEIIIIDDASTDSTLSIVEDLASADNRIKVIALPSNSGPAAARNVGILAARGDWIAFLDADDSYKPTRLEVIQRVASCNGCDVIVDNLVLFDSEVSSEVCDAFSWGPLPFGVMSYSEFIQNDRFGIGFPAGWLKPVIRREFLMKHELGYKAEYRYSEDFHFMSEIFLSGATVIKIHKPYYIYSTRIGIISGEASSGSRTVENFDDVRKSMHRLMLDSHDKMSFSDRKILNKRVSSSYVYERLLRCKDMYSNSDFFGVFCTIVRDPRIIGLLLARRIFKVRTKKRLAEDSK